MCAWVRLSSKDHSMVAVSQGGTRSSAAYLIYIGGTTDRWSFGMTGSDVDNPWQYWVYANAAPVVGQWTHLCGVYDASANQLSVYSNGVVQSSIGRGAGAWSATGDLRVGSRWWNGSAGSFLNGDVDDVRIYDRALSIDDIGAIVTHDNGLITPADSPGDDSIARWQFDEGDGSIAGGRAPEAGLARNAGPSWTPDGQVGGALHLDGGPADAETSGAVLNTSADFSVCAWARLADTDRSMAVVSQGGQVSYGFSLVYSAPDNQWQFRMARQDGYGSGEDWAGSPDAPVVGQWTYLCGVYQAAANQLSVYVDGVVQTSQVRTTAAWNATGRLRVGAMQWNASLRNFFSGDVDDVQLFGRVLSDGEILGLHDGVQPTGATAHWTLDGGSGGTPGEALTLTTGPSWADNGKVGGAMQFDGWLGEASTSGPIVPDTSADFSVCAWARLAAKDHAMTVVGQAGTVSSAFYLLYSAVQDRWMFGMARADGYGSAEDRMYSLAAPTVDQWTHLCGVYRASTLTLYVNGVAQAAAISHASPWKAMGRLTVGDVQWDGGVRNFLNGDVDELRVYNRALGSGEPAVIANTNPGVANDSSALNHPLALSGGAMLASGGHSGNGLAFDGVDDVASTSAAVLRTDQSFTVAAWVKLSGVDGTYTIAGQDGVNDAGFALQWVPGPIWDYEYGGSWQFRIDDGDSAASESMSNVEFRPDSDPVDRWAHLTASYDSFTHTLSLRVRDSATTGREVAVMSTKYLPWNAAGVLQIGRERSGLDNDTGSPVYDNYLFGTVDEVNVFQGVPSEADIRQLIANS